MHSGRTSVMSTVIREFRKKKENNNEGHGKQISSLMVTKLLGKFMTSQKTQLGSKTTKAIPKIKFTSHNLDTIPEDRQRAFSVSTLRNNGDNGLINQLLHRNHSIFKSSENHISSRKDSSISTLFRKY